MIIETWFEQDLMKPVQVQYVNGNVFSQDNMGNRIGVKLYKDGVAHGSEGTISASVIRADGATLAVTGSSSGNTAWVDLPQAAYAVPGLLTIVIKSTTVSSAVTTICAALATVYRSSTDSIVDPGTVIPSISDLIAQIQAAIASIPADYSSLWNKLAATFDASTTYAVGDYCLYNGNLYRFKAAHEGTWSTSDVLAVTVGNELTYANSSKKAVADLIYNYGTDGTATVRLVGEIVPYRYRNTTRLDSQSSVRYKLPKNVRTVNISMSVLQNLNSYTFTDAAGNVLTYKYEDANADVTYTDINAFEAEYLVCCNNNTLFTTIIVDATIAGIGIHIDEAKKTSDVKYTMLSGVNKNYSYLDFDQSEGEVSIEYDVSGYDRADITSYTVSTRNKYTLLDSNGNIVGYYHTTDASETGQTTNVQITIPTNASKLLVSSTRADRPNTLVYGVTMPESYGWTRCAGTFVDYRYQGTTRQERVNGSKEFPASPFDIFKLVDGAPTANINVFTAFDSNGEVIGFVSLHDYEITDETYFICPRGTVKVAVAAAAIASGGWTTCAPMTIIKRKTTKKLSVMGDSISTFEHFSPDDYNPFYASGRDGLPNASYSYWGIIAREKGWALSSINAYGGSQVSDYDPQARYGIAMCSTTRTSGLAGNGTPDYIIILGGTNDFGHGVPIGSWAGMADMPTTGEDFRKAYALMLNRVHANYPLAMVYCCTLPNRERDAVPGSLEKYHDQYLHQFNDAVRQIAPMLNCRVIDLESCGINQYNLETYMSDYHEDTGVATHPNIAGHALIAQRILEELYRRE